MRTRKYSESAAGTYLPTFFSATAGLLVALGVFNVVVDPTASFGFGWTEPVVWTARYDKTRLFLDRARQPRTLLLGSSRVMKVPTAALEQSFGAPAFNFAVNSGRAEDYLGILAFVQAEGVQIETLVVGVDVEAFHERSSVSSRLIAVPALTTALPLRQLWIGRLRNLSRAFSFERTELSIRALLPRNADKRIEFDEHGFLMDDERELRIASGNFDLASAVEKSKHEYQRRFRKFSGLAPWRVAQFHELARRANEAETALVLFITSLHPAIVASLTETTHYARLRSDVMSELRQISAAHGACVFDATDIETFGGRPEDFYDGAHPTARNNERLMQALRRQAGCAFQ